MKIFQYRSVCFYGQVLGTNGTGWKSRVREFNLSVSFIKISILKNFHEMFGLNRTVMGLAMAHDSADPLEKIIAVGVVPENFPALNPSNDNLMHRPGASILALRGMIFKYQERNLGLTIESIYVPCSALFRCPSP